jgi:hypothetical protein
VLIDEIDAHMHPRWQQTIVPKLSRSFPRIQFIATTHAPLIVAGLPVSQVIRFDRNPEGKVVRLRVEEDMTKGRTDQLLTSNLFGLDTTLDQTTQGVISEMQRLMVKPARSRKEEKRLEQLRRDLTLHIPVALETPPERRAFELVNALLTQQVLELAGASDPALLEAAKQELLHKAQQLLDEVQSRQRVPS